MLFGSFKNIKYYICTLITKLLFLTLNIHISKEWGSPRLSGPVRLPPFDEKFRIKQFLLALQLVVSASELHLIDLEI